VSALKLKPHEHDVLARAPRRPQATYLFPRFCECVRAWGNPRPNCLRCRGNGFEPLTIEEAAHQASIGANDSLWLACHDIAHEAGFYNDHKMTNEQLCECAIRRMTPQERALYFTETES
jgi:hypothetical protein